MKSIILHHLEPMKPSKFEKSQLARAQFSYDVVPNIKTAELATKTKVTRRELIKDSIYFTSMWRDITEYENSFNWILEVWNKTFSSVLPYRYNYKVYFGFMTNYPRIWKISNKSTLHQKNSRALNFTQNRWNAFKLNSFRSPFFCPRYVCTWSYFKGTLSWLF